MSLYSKEYEMVQKIIKKYNKYTKCLDNKQKGTSRLSVVSGVTRLAGTCLDIKFFAVPEMSHDNTSKITLKEIAYLFGEHKTNLKDWGLIPSENIGKGRVELYDLKHVIEVFKERFNPDIVKDKITGEIINIKDEEAKLKKHKARLEELKVLEKEGELLDASTVEKGYADFFVEVRTKISNIHAELSKQLENSECQLYQ